MRGRRPAPGCTSTGPPGRSASGCAPRCGWPGRSGRRTARRGWPPPSVRLEQGRHWPGRSRRRTGRPRRAGPRRRGRRRRRPPATAARPRSPRGDGGARRRRRSAASPPASGPWAGAPAGGRRRGRETTAARSSARTQPRLARAEAARGGEGAVEPVACSMAGARPRPSGRARAGWRRSAARRARPRRPARTGRRSGRTGRRRPTAGRSRAARLVAKAKTPRKATPARPISSSRPGPWSGPALIGGIRRRPRHGHHEEDGGGGAPAGRTARRAWRAGPRPGAAVGSVLRESACRGSSDRSRNAGCRSFGRLRAHGGGGTARGVAGAASSRSR